MTIELSRRKILSLARKLLRRDAAATMEDVAAATGVSLRSLYRRFHNREDLVRAADPTRRAPPSAEARILGNAFELLGGTSLAELSMDALADAAGVSRATLYRLYPGKPALFAALVGAYSPWEPVAGVLEDAGDRAPSHVIPRVATAIAEALHGKTGILLRMVFEMVTGNPDTLPAVRRSLARGLPDLVEYLAREMAAGRLRRIHPIIAVQLLAGPIFVHVATRPLARMLGLRLSPDDVVGEIAAAWLRALQPSG